jgi:diguanylate cyclase (GGDEF)-like protein
MKDTLTGLLNRPGWDGKVAIEETRARRYGSPTCIVKFAINGLEKTEDAGGCVAKDALIKQAAVCILNKVSESDSVAHLGGGEFAVLGVEWDLEKAKATISEIVQAMERHRIDSRVGLARRNPSKGLSAAVEEADRFLAASRVA